MKCPEVRNHNPPGLSYSIVGDVGRQDSGHKRPQYWEIGHKSSQSQNKEAGSQGRLRKLLCENLPKAGRPATASTL